MPAKLIYYYTFWVGKYIFRTRNCAVSNFISTVMGGPNGPKQKLFYFEWSPPWHIGWGLSGWTTVPYNSENSQTMPHIQYFWSISQACLMFWTWHDTSLARNSCNAARIKHLMSFIHCTHYIIHSMFSTISSSPRISSETSSDIFSDILSLTFFLNSLQRYLLTFFLTYLLTRAHHCGPLLAA